MVVFTSDNGGESNVTSNAPLRGGKSELYEGGIRVPFIVTWPGKLPAGKTYDHPVSSLDVGATAVALAGLDKDPKLDGINLIPHLKDMVKTPPHEKLFWRFWNQAAVRKGQWKYYQAGDRKFLFDLSSPEHEKVNRIKEHPKLAAELEASLKAWTQELKNPGMPEGELNGAELKWVDHFLPK